MNKSIIILLILVIIAIVLLTPKSKEHYGANCAWSTATKYTAEQLADYTPGQSIDSSGACYGNTDIKTDFITYGIVPNSKEFTYLDSGDGCNACSVNYPNKVTAGVCTTGLNPDCKSYTWSGSTMTFTRKDTDGYLADKNDCCFNSASTVGDYTCDPSYRSIGSSSCITQLKDTCGTASGFSSNVEGCKEFCGLEAAAGKTTCDNLIYTYCKSDTGKSDSSCDCINNYAEAEEAQIEANIYGDAVCTYSKCQSGSNPLLTEKMTNKDCSICNAVNTNNTVTNNTGSPITFTATCSIGTSSGSSDTSSDTSSDSSSDSSTNSTTTEETTIISWLTNNWIMLTIIAVVLVIIIIVIIIITTS